jgi:hypothetical protein
VSRIIFIAVTIALVLANPNPAVGQILYGGLLGNVTDPTGPAIPRTSVTIIR